MQHASSELLCITDDTIDDDTLQAAAADGQKKHAKQLQAMEAAYERRQAAQVSSTRCYWCNLQY
jgi:hypothetical protein